MNQGEPSRSTESERRLRHNFRLARLLRFLELVASKEAWNPKSLMQELEVSERTIHRLRETLELAGVPLYFSKEENAYRIRHGFHFPKLNLSVDEAFGQANATALSESSSLKLPIGAVATTRKLADSGNEQVRRILQDASRFTQIIDLKIADQPEQKKMIQTVQQSLLDRRMIQGKYRSPHEAKPILVNLHPYRIALIKQAWYLIARPDQSELPITYRIVRFQSLKPIESMAIVPDDFDLRAYLGNAWSVYRGEESFEIELRFNTDAADTVLEHHWHHTQQIKKHPNGEVTLRFTVDGLNEILRWVVGWAGRVRVLKPKRLRELVVKQHQEAISINTSEND